MIAFLSGEIKEKRAQSLILDVGGVGYELFLSTQSLSKMPANGGNVSVHTYLYVREDQMQLFGFATSEEKELFTQLISVGGIGPKVALSILSSFTVSSFKKAILTADIDLIVGIPGVGKKSAQRLILELKERLSLPEEISFPSSKASSAYTQAREALLNLGYSLSEAKRALEGFGFEREEIEPEELVKYALKNLGK